MDDRDALAAFQSDLLRLLRQGVQGEALVTRIRADHGEPWASWVSRFDPRAVAVSRRILHRWLRDAQ